MTASADKVQYILQNLLEQSIPLVKRGIFSQVELKDIMLRRQKCQNSMLKREYQMTDYLAAIQYEYSLQRERKFRMDELAKIEQGHTNPIYRKQSSSDFAIVKRIIRLWDKTMHKFKFRLALWKQYLSFTIAIGSKKHFYKALTNALRFMPFELDLWRIGVAYEQEKGHNMWKARKILIKGMKMIPSGNKNVELGQQMIRFQVQFLKMILERRQIIQKGEEGMKFVGDEEGMKFVGDEEEIKLIGEEDKEHSQDHNEGQEALDNINLQDYDKMVWIIVEEIISKNRKEEVQQLKFTAIKQRLLALITELLLHETKKQITVVLTKVREQLHNYQLTASQPANQTQTQAVDIKLQNKVKIEGGIQRITNDWQKLETAKQQIINNQANDINWKAAELALKCFCLKPSFLAQLYSFLLDINFCQTVLYLCKNKAAVKLPTNILVRLIKAYPSNDKEGLTLLQIEEYRKYLIAQIDRRLLSGDFKQSKQLLKYVLQFNAAENRFQKTTKLMRSLSIAFKHDPEYLQMVTRLSNSN